MRGAIMKSENTKLLARNPSPHAQDDQGDRSSGQRAEEYRTASPPTKNGRAFRRSPTAQILQYKTRTNLSSANRVSRQKTGGGKGSNRF